MPLCTKPDISKAETREERQELLMELPRLYKEFNQCKEREEEDRIQWEIDQEASIPLRIAEDKQRKINVIREALELQKQEYEASVQKAKEAKLIAEEE